MCFSKHASYRVVDTSVLLLFLKVRNVDFFKAQVRLAFHPPVVSVGPLVSVFTVMLPFCDLEHPPHNHSGSRLFADLLTGSSHVVSTARKA